MSAGTETSQSSANSSPETPKTAVESYPEAIIAVEPAFPDVVQGAAAYARLAGTGKGVADFLIRTKVVTIGRAGCGTDFELRSDSRTVSRHHATIFWIAETDSWAITCFSRTNALTVDGTPVLADAPPMPLKSKNLVEIGDAAFFFLGAIDPTVRTDDIGYLERQVEDLRADRKRKQFSDVEPDSRNIKISRRSSFADIARVVGSGPRKQLLNYRAPRKAGDLMKHDSNRLDQATSYENQAQTPAVENRGGRAPRKHSQAASQRIDRQSRQNNQRGSMHTHTNICRRNPRRDETDTEEEDNEVASRGSLRAKSSKRSRLDKDSASRVLGSERGTDSQSDVLDSSHALVSAFHDDELHAGEPDQANDGFDVAPVPSLAEFRARSSASSRRPCNSINLNEEWNKKERADFCRALFALGVDGVYNSSGRLVQYDWSRFRGIARLERKTDPMLSEYYERMMNDVEFLLAEEAREKQANGPRTKHKQGCDCIVCENTRKSRRKKEVLNAGRDNPHQDVELEFDTGYGVQARTSTERETGSAFAKSEGDPNMDRVIGLVTAQKLRVRMGIHDAARQVDSIGGQNVMRKLRNQSRRAAANGELPDWWVNGIHDHALMIGVARFGVGQWNDIWVDIHNPDFVRARSAEGAKIDWPSPQAAMKRLREISSAINAELRRLAKKRAKGPSDVTPNKKLVQAGQRSSPNPSRPIKKFQGRLSDRERNVKAMRSIGKDFVTEKGPDGVEDNSNNISRDMSGDSDPGIEDESPDNYDGEEVDEYPNLVAADDAEEEIEFELEEEDGEDEDMSETNTSDASD